MKLLDDIETTVKLMLDDAVKSKNKQLELNLQRLGSDVVVLAEQIERIVTGLSNHKEAIEQLCDDHKSMVYALTHKPTMKWPSLGTKKNYGPN